MATLASQEAGDPTALGCVHEVFRDDRLANGAVYTPPMLARALVSLVLTQDEQKVLDPAVGGGAFLLAAAEHLLRARPSSRAAVVRCLWGVDVDPRALRVTMAALAWWSCLDGSPPAWPDEVQFRHGDALDLDGAVPFAGFDAVVGNPPFQGQFRRATARRRTPTSAANPGGDRRSDTALVFLEHACRLTRPGGRVLLVQPQSVLASQGGARLRRAIGVQARIAGMWVGAPQDIGASVDVCAPLLVVDGAEYGGSSCVHSIHRWTGPRCAPTSAVDQRALSLELGDRWSVLIADLISDCELDVEATGVWQGRLGDRARVTAGFRQHFYGLAPFVREHRGHGEPSRAVAPPCAPLVTVGGIDPLHLRWGRAPARIAGETLQAACVDLDALHVADPSLSRWVLARRVPKVLVATQAKALEAAVDRRGDVVPATPVISVEPFEEEDLDWLAAVLCAPPVSAWMWQRRAGSGLSTTTMRVSAADVAEVPLPRDSEWWERGARAASDATYAAEAGDEAAWRGALDTVGVTMTLAYGFSEAHPVIAWWRARLPAWRCSGGAGDAVSG